jgi:hypothetical protein
MSKHCTYIIPATNKSCKLFIGKNKSKHILFCSKHYKPTAGGLDNAVSVEAQVSQPKEDIDTVLQHVAQNVEQDQDVIYNWDQIKRSNAMACVNKTTKRMCTGKCKWKNGKCNCDPKFLRNLVKKIMNAPTPLTEDYVKKHLSSEPWLAHSLDLVSLGIDHDTSVVPSMLLAIQALPPHVQCLLFLGMHAMYKNNKSVKEDVLMSLTVLPNTTFAARRDAIVEAISQGLNIKDDENEDTGGISQKSLAILSVLMLGGSVAYLSYAFPQVDMVKFASAMPLIDAAGSAAYLGYTAAKNAVYPTLENIYEAIKDPTSTTLFKKVLNYAKKRLSTDHP